MAPKTLRRDKRAHGREIEAALSSATCPVQLIPPGVSGLTPEQAAHTRRGWLLRPTPVEGPRIALASERAPSIQMEPGCARIFAATGGSHHKR